MRIPRVITLCGHQVRIQYRKGIVLNGHECWGVCNSEKHVITLRYGMNDSQRKEILLHEIAHFISDIHLLNLSEKAVKILGIELLAAMTNNKLNFQSRAKKK